MLWGMRLQSQGSAHDSKRSGQPRKLTSEAAVEAAALLRAPQSHWSYLQSGYNSLQDACMRCRELRVDPGAFGSFWKPGTKGSAISTAGRSLVVDQGPMQLFLRPAVPPTLHTDAIGLSRLEAAEPTKWSGSEGQQAMHQDWGLGGQPRMQRAGCSGTPQLTGGSQPSSSCRPKP